jgi:hypothetical protein
MAENAKDSDERDLRGGRCCAPVRLVDQERRAELDRQGNGLGFTGVQFLGILGYEISVQLRSAFNLTASRRRVV